MSSRYYWLWRSLTNTLQDSPYDIDEIYYFVNASFSCDVHTASLHSTCAWQMTTRWGYVSVYLHLEGILDLMTLSQRPVHVLMPLTGSERSMTWDTGNQYWASHTESGGADGPGHVTQKRMAIWGPHTSNQCLQLYLPTWDISVLHGLNFRLLKCQVRPTLLECSEGTKNLLCAWEIFQGYGIGMI